MELIPAPSRQLKTYSTWLAIGLAVLSAVYAALPSFQELLSPSLYGSLVAGLALAIKIVSLIKQNFPVTQDQKDAMVSSAASTPTKE